MSDLFYIDDGYFDVGYFVYTAVADATVTSECQLTVAAGIIAEGAATVSSESSLDCTAAKIVSAESIQLTVGSVSLQANVTSSASTDLSVESTLLASAERVQTANITLETIVSLSLQADKLIDTTALLAADVQVAASAIRYISFIGTSPTPFYAKQQALISTEHTSFGTHSLLIPTVSSGASTNGGYAKFSIPSADTSDLSIGEASRFEIAFWFRPTNTPSFSQNNIISFGTFNTNNSWTVRQNSARTISFSIRDNSGTTSTATPSFALTNNEWHYIQISREWLSSVQRGRLTIRINGDGVFDQANFNRGTNTVGNILHIGAGAGLNSVRGYIDGLRIDIGRNAQSTSVPTEDTLFGNAFTQLLMNWNDNPNGNWFDDSLSSLETGAAALSSTATLTAEIGKVVNGIAALSSTATVVAEGSIDISAIANLNSTATLSASAKKFTGGAAALSSTFTLTAAALDLDLAAAALQVTSTVTAAVNRRRSTTVSLNSNSQITTVIKKTANAVANLSATGFVLSIGLRLKPGAAALSSTSTVSVTARKTVRPSVAINSTATVNAVARKDVKSAAALSSTATLTSLETRIVNVFVNSARSQLIFRNNINAPNVVFLKQGTVSFSGIRYDAVLGFWASGTGVVYSTGFTDSISASTIRLTDEDEFIFQSPEGSRTWSGIDTLSNNHYLLNNSTLYVNGESQGTGTLVGSNPRLGPPQVSGIGFSGSYGTRVTFDGFRAGFQFFTGTISQLVRYQVGFNVDDVPDFNLESERLKLYNNGFVDIGELGMDTGLPRPADYFRLDRFNDRPVDGSNAIRNRGSWFFSIVNANWKQMGEPFVYQDDQYRSVLNYTPTAQDDTGPFEIVSTLTAAPISVQTAVANLSSVSTVTANAAKLIGIIEQFSSEATVVADIERIRSGSADLQVVGSKLTVAVKTGRILVTIEASSTVSAAARKDVVASSALNSISTVSATARKDVESAVTLTTDTALLCDFDRIRPGAGQFVCDSTTTVTAIKQARGNSNMQAEFEISANPFGLLKAQALLTSESTVVAGSIITARATSNLQVQSTQVSNVTRIVGFECDMLAFNAVLAIGTKLTLDPYYQLTVPRELRHNTIAQEPRILSIDSENRLNTIQAQNRLLMVPSETRVWHIPYSPQQGTRRVK